MRQRLLMIATIVGTVGVITGAALLASRYLAAPPPQAPVCSTPGTQFTDVIANDQLSITQIDGKLCDTLTILNNDPKVRVIAFGPHDHHVAYDGVVEKVLGESQSFTITFIKPGTYTFHDHDDESIRATFTVGS